MIKFQTAVLLFLTIGATCAAADDSLLTDQNGDNGISLFAFGDSITYGLGDGMSVADSLGKPPAGYPKRVSAATGLPITNAGLPGEQFVADGAARFGRLIGRSNADVVLFLEGSNDAVQQLPVNPYRDKLQRVINTSIALGKTPVILTIPPACCEHAGQRPFADSYNRAIEQLAALNSVHIADIERAWATTCVNHEECELYNLPEGLHPNAKGYTVMAQTVLATLYGIDIFSDSGAGDLASALGIDPSEILVKPAAPVAPVVPPATDDSTQP